MSYFKSKIIRSNKLRESARGQPCSLRLPGCDGGGETTVLAHLPLTSRGVGFKTSDVNGIFACANCHDQLDLRVEPDVDVPEMLRSCLRAHDETMQTWIDDGLIQVQGAKNG